MNLKKTIQTKNRLKTNIDRNAPKPVHPKSVNDHGLLSMGFVRQHMMADENWSPNSLTEEFKGMSNLLSRRLVFKKLEARENRMALCHINRTLKRQCHVGRTKLRTLMAGDSTRHIRNFLMNHKDMQRLYQHMPLHLAMNNINQRTFVMRKERDRLRYRLDQLKNQYKKQLIQKSALENRMKYVNLFVLDEEVKMNNFNKNIKNSEVRLQAIKTINSTYAKMLQILKHDSIFYEPILKSLSSDIDDQTNFIKHILYLGFPAIHKFKELGEEYRLLEEKARSNIQEKNRWIEKNCKIVQHKRNTITHILHNKTDEYNARHYLRETTSMQHLKNQLESIESVIKQVKFTSLCSQTKEIYPLIKSQMENNFRLEKMIGKDQYGYQSLDSKMKRAEVLEGVLINNLSDEELHRLKRIKRLKDAIDAEDEYERETLAHIKNRADAYIVLRCTLWNLVDILRHVDKPKKVPRVAYKSSYLTLPLLKFEMQSMCSYPPETFEENIDELMNTVKRKLAKVVAAYKVEFPQSKLQENLKKYYNDFVDSAIMDNAPTESEEVIPEVDDTQSRVPVNVLSRKQIKANSAKLVEECAKKDE